jgi:hypothetical protein
MRALFRPIALALAALAIAFASPAARAGGNGWHGGGGWHGGYGHWHGGVTVGIGVGPWWYGGYYPYYPYYGYYGYPYAYPYGAAYGGYVVATPAAVPATAAPAEPAHQAPPEPIYYPRQGQSPAQSEADIRDCNRWATSLPNAMADSNVFNRATAACMDAHGYTVR